MFYRWEGPCAAPVRGAGAAQGRLWPAGGPPRLRRPSPRLPGRGRAARGRRQRRDSSTRRRRRIPTSQPPRQRGHTPSGSPVNHQSYASLCFLLIRWPNLEKDFFVFFVVEIFSCYATGSFAACVVVGLRRDSNPEPRIRMDCIHHIFVRTLYSVKSTDPVVIHLEFFCLNQHSMYLDPKHSPRSVSEKVSGVRLILFELCLFMPDKYVLLW